MSDRLIRPPVKPYRRTREDGERKPLAQIRLLDRARQVAL